jgi:hypothetical protein
LAVIVYSLTAPKVSPRTKWLWIRKPKTITGMVEIVPMAAWTP